MKGQPKHLQIDKKQRITVSKQNKLFERLKLKPQKKNDQLFSGSNSIIIEAFLKMEILYRVSPLPQH